MALVTAVAQVGSLARGTSACGCGQKKEKKRKEKEKEKKAKVKDGLFSGISSLLLIFCEVHRGCAMGGLCSKERELGTWATSLFLMS